MRLSNRILMLVAAVTMFMAVLAVPAQAGPEGTLLSRINASRANAGLAPLEQYWDLTDDARSHTSAMIGAGHIYHNPGLAGVTGVWEKLGENVGVGFDANGLHESFMASSGHRANILGDFNYVGIGVATDDDGLMWTTVIFMKAAPGLNGGDTTTTTAAPTTTTTVASVPAADSVTPTTYEVKPVVDTAPKATVKTVQPANRVPEPKPERTMIVRWGRPDGRPAIAI